MADPKSAGLFRRIFFSIHSYIALYALFGVLSLSYHACFNTSLSTLEKRYHFSSSTGGYIMITDNIATVLTNLFIGFYGKNVHKPRWMAVGCVITGLSVMVSAFPYFIYGPAQSIDLELAANMTLSKAKNSDSMCLLSPVKEDCSGASADKIMTIVAVSCFALSNFFRGFGTSIYFTLGTPYMDDNVDKAKMPTFFAMTFAARILGAPIGYSLSSIALKYYENPFHVPKNLVPTDPQWIGAWWIGFLISGSLLLVLAVPLSLFPREFKKKDPPNSVLESPEGLQLVTKGEPTAAQTQVVAVWKPKVRDEALQLKDIPKEVVAVLSNPVILCQLVGNMFRGVGILGAFVFQTKYMESMFRQSASKASLVSGTTGFLAKVGGVMFGGLLITLCRPGPRVLTTFIFLVEVTSVFTLLMGAQVTGPIYEYPYTSVKPASKELDLFNQCNRNCYCDNVRYQPVCEPQPAMKAYFSPCHAGCRNQYKHIDGGNTYTDCSCIASANKILEKCQPDTFSLYRYVSIIALGSMISGSSRPGNMVTFFRSINPDEKTMATGVASTWHSLFVSIPYPIIYGLIFDHCCLVWSRECGKRGNCWLYDTDKLRRWYHGVSIALIALGSVFDLIMIYLSPRLGKLYDDEEIKTSFKDRLMFWKSKKRAVVATTTSEIETGVSQMVNEENGTSRRQELFSKL